MSTAVKFAYRHLPVKNRFGQGEYTYTLIQEGQATVNRYEIFASTLQQAMDIASCLLAIAGCTPIDHNTWEIYPVLYDGCRWYIYLD